MTRPKKIICLLLIFSIYLGAVFTLAQDNSMKNEKNGLQFRLSEGAEESVPVPANKPAQAEPLSAAETQKVLQRLPPLQP